MCVKGAPESLLSRCTQSADRARGAALERLRTARRSYRGRASMAGEALRVLGLAYRAS